MDAVVAALAIALISSGSAIVVGLVGAWLAKRKGLPGINAEVEQRMQQLVNTLRTEIEAKTGELAEKVTALEACRAELGNVRREHRETKLDLRNTEGELLELYRLTGRTPPKRLADHAGG